MSDPHRVLGVAQGASDEEVRAAWLEGVRRFPPDRCPEDFERLREAYDALRDPRRRAAALLEADDPDRPLEELLGEPRRERRFAGPGPWLEAIRP